MFIWLQTWFYRLLEFWRRDYRQEALDHLYDQIFEAPFSPVKDVEFPDPVWWVCRMKDGGYFAVPYERPDGGDIIFDPSNPFSITIAAGSYLVVYGPAPWPDARDYMTDMAEEEQ